MGSTQVFIQFTCVEPGLIEDLFVTRMYGKDGGRGIYFSKNLGHGLSVAFGQEIAVFGKVTKASMRYLGDKGGNSLEWQRALCMGMSWIFTGVILNEVFKETCLFLPFNWVPCLQHLSATSSCKTVRLRFPSGLLHRH